MPSSLTEKQHKTNQPWLSRKVKLILDSQSKTRHSADLQIYPSLLRRSPNSLETLDSGECFNLPSVFWMTDVPRASDELNTRRNSWKSQHNIYTYLHCWLIDIEFTWEKTRVSIIQNLSFISCLGLTIRIAPNIELFNISIKWKYFVSWTSRFLLSSSLLGKKKRQKESNLDFYYSQTLWHV